MLFQYLNHPCSFIRSYPLTAFDSHRRHKEDPSLGSWGKFCFGSRKRAISLCTVCPHSSFVAYLPVSAQRRQYKIVTSGQSGSTAMTLDRAKKLADIGFEWSTINPNHVTWETRFEELKEFVVRRCSFSF